MRRGVGVIASVALVSALALGIARAAQMVPATGVNDIGVRVMLELFGETTDTRASFAAAHGDRASESPFRDLALQVRAPAPKIEASSVAGAAFGEERLAPNALVAVAPAGVSVGEPFTATPSLVHFTVSSPGTGDAAVLMPPGEHFTVAYQPVQPQPAISPAPGTLAFAPPETHALDFVPEGGQIGAVRFEGHSTGDESAALPQLTLSDKTYGAGANFDVRAGKRNVNVDLSSEYQQAGHDFDSFSIAAPASPASWQLSAGNAPVFLPNSMDLNRLSLGAGVSVPVVHGLTLNLDYDAQRLYGGYGLPGLLNLDTVSNTYGGKLTFNIPRLSSSLSIGAYQDRFQDSILPINGQTQTREDVNFTVKF